MYLDDIALTDMSEVVNYKWYKDKDYHTMYIGEIVGCYINE